MTGTLLLLIPNDEATVVAGAIEANANVAGAFIGDADFALARRILLRLRNELRRGGIGLWSAVPSSGVGPAAAAAEQWTHPAQVTVASNSELYARFSSADLAGWRRPIYRVRMAGDVSSSSSSSGSGNDPALASLSASVGVLAVGARLRRASAESVSGDGSGEVLGVVRRVEARTVAGVVVSTTAFVATSLA